ncbi:FadR/GntR family transcriptional regulator [Nocardioides humi]|uniref:FadR/GntR family transcriptional regulator n=1 Tax=Nocardioides humi TaxID=449461 RepID=A0ABN2AB69_9ACTN|nr:FCD domain-containing protein [Nocardioides humi]
MNGPLEDVSTFAPQRVQGPRHQVERQIREAILGGVFPAGSRLPSETSLAEDFGVSRATVREALRSLAASGLVMKTRGSGGTFAQYVDHRLIQDALSERVERVLEMGTMAYDEVATFRDLLEVPSARLAAEHRTEADLVALHAVIDAEKATTVDDPAVLELNAEFHSRIAQASRNRMLEACITALHSVARPLSFIDTDHDLGAQAVKHHIALYAAIQEGEPEAAAREMGQHLAFLRQHVAR